MTITTCLLTTLLYPSVVTDLISSGDGQTQLETGLKKFVEYREQANLELRKNAFKYHSAILTASKEMQGKFLVSVYVPFLTLLNYIEHFRAGK